MPDRGFYRSHLEDDVLGWWLAHGPDTESGRVRTGYATRTTRWSAATSTPGRKAAECGSPPGSATA
jgi:hypothetical protein